MIAALSAIALAALVMIAAPTAAQAVPSDAVQCPPGSYSSTGYSSVTDSVTCVLAPAGKYVDLAGATAANPCPPGTYQSAAGQMYCLLADPGYFVAFSNSVAADPCPLGTFQANAGSVSCTPANTGTFVDMMGANAAQNCPSGFTTAGLGSVSVADCSVSLQPATPPAAPAPVVTPTPTPTPSETATPMPTESPMPVVISAPVRKAQVVSLAKIPTRMKVNGKFQFSNKNASGLTVKATVTGTCKIATLKGKYQVTATKKTGTCTLRLTNAGSTSYLPLAKRVAIKVSR